MTLATCCGSPTQAEEASRPQEGFHHSRPCFCVVLACLGNSKWPVHASLRRSKAMPHNHLITHGFEEWCQELCVPVPCLNCAQLLLSHPIAMQRPQRASNQIITREMCPLAVTYPHHEFVGVQKRVCLKANRIRNGRKDKWAHMHRVKRPFGPKPRPSALRPSNQWHPVCIFKHAQHAACRLLDKSHTHTLVARLRHDKEWPTFEE